MATTHIVDLHGTEGQSVYGKLNLIQIGRLKCDAGHVIAKHTHLNWFELTCVTEGEGKIAANEGEVEVKKGDIFLSFPCEAHSIVSSKESPLCFDHFAFYPCSNEYLQYLEQVMVYFAPSKKRVFRNYRIWQLLDGCINRINNRKDFLQDYLSSSFSLILIELLGSFKVKCGDAFEMISNMAPDKLCLTIKNYIDTHLFSLSSLSELSSICGYNYSYLSYLFKKSTGLTLSDYYKTKRFESAKLMIAENRLRIGEISNLLGYSSVYAFSKAFKDEFGVSPKNYYKQLFNAEN